MWLQGSRTGSSPRVRGTARLNVAESVTRRFIPACAGNRARTARLENTGSVHPRVCGEQASARLYPLDDAGSSPRVRGTVHDSPRFIPACAGNRGFPAISVHPRVCGEQAGRQAAGARISGSSPRVRGTVRQVLTVANCNRFIPACAGNREEQNDYSVFQTVHPRVCGEQPT